MVAYVNGCAEPPAAFPDAATYDQRYFAPCEAGYRARTIRDLAGTWAVDPDYHTKIVAKHRAMFGAGEEPVSDNLTYGRVPYPAVVESHLSGSNPYVQTGGAPDVPEAVFWHRMVGTLLGTDIHFHGGHAATAYGVGVAATDGNKAGVIYEWIKPRTGWYGESSGPAVAPYGDGAALIAKVGVASVNRTTVAIEISGDYDTPLDDKARAAIVNLTAYWADQRRIPWHAFPIVPGEDRSFVVWHQEITGPAYKACPGAVVMGETTALIARVAAVLRAAQTTVTPEPPTPPKPPVYAAPVLPDWWAEALAQSWPSDARDGDLMYRVCRRRAEAIKPAVRRAQPSKLAARSGPNLAVREKVFVERIVQGTDGKQYLVTNDGHYVLAASLTPAISIKPR